MRLIRVCLLGCSFLLLALPLFACTCRTGPGNMREIAAREIERASVVFEGTVEKQEFKQGRVGAPENAFSFSGYGTHRIVTLLSKRVYRGSAQERFVIVTAANEAACGFDFDTGSEYLVFATATKIGDLSTSLCSSTELSQHSGPALRYLRAETPLPEDLLKPAEYSERMWPQWTGTVCGRVMQADGTPLNDAVVALSQLRDEPLPSRRFSDGDLSDEKGKFCIEALPGNYVLSARKSNRQTDGKYMGYYPSFARYSEATTIEVKAAAKISNLQFRVREVALHRVRIQVVSADNVPLPWEWISVAISSLNRDDLAYHGSHGIKENGSYIFGRVPPGRYRVRAFRQPSVPEVHGKAPPPDLAGWEPIEQVVDIVGDSEITLKLRRAQQRGGGGGCPTTND